MASEKAIPCRRQVHGEMGGATVHMLRLPDGFLLDCGTDFYAEARAQLLANVINASGPEGLDVDVMMEQATGGVF